MAALDRCDRRHDRGTVVVAAAGVPPSRRGWSTELEMRSPRHLTRLQEPNVVATAWADPAPA